MEEVFAIVRDSGNQAGGEREYVCFDEMNEDKWASWLQNNWGDEKPKLHKVILCFVNDVGMEQKDVAACFMRNLERLGVEVGEIECDTNADVLKLDEFTL